jgi:mannose-1-phosphate guanylyltransferase
VDNHSVIGEGATLEAGARVEGSLVLDGASVGRGCRVRGSILGYDTALAEGENLEDAVLAEVEGARHRTALEGGES